MTRLLRMKPEYITWTKEGRKRATTRMHDLQPGEYELIHGSRFNPKKSGVRVEIKYVLVWKARELDSLTRQLIAWVEGFQTWDEFWAVILEINKDKGVDHNTEFHTYLYTKLDESPKPL